MPEIPYDIYPHIAKFLPDDVLRELITIPGFFDIAMNVRYNEATISLGDSKNIAKMLGRLEDPFVAKRVRRLNVHLDVDDCGGKKTRSHVDKLYGRFDFPAHSKPNYHGVHPSQGRFEEKMQALTDIIVGLSNIVALHISMNNLVLHDQSKPFFQAAWKTFGLNLRVLSLHGNLCCLQIPLSLDLSSSQLQDLQLEFSHPVCTSCPLDNATILCDTIVPAVSRFSPILQRLSISSRHGHSIQLDLSPFFLSLAPLPRLERLVVHISFSNLSNSFGLTRILRNHASTLRHISLKLDYGNEIFPTVEERLMLLCDLRSNKIIFTNLETFEFAPFHVDFDVAKTYFMRSADTLTSLTVLNRSLKYREVTSLIHIFSHRPPALGLQILSLTVKSLEPRLLASLARNLPGLKTLNLSYRAWDVADDPMFSFDHAPAGKFLKELIPQRKLFKSWKISQLTLLPIGDDWMFEKLMFPVWRLFAEWVPALTPLDRRRARQQARR